MTVTMTTQPRSPHDFIALAAIVSAVSAGNPDLERIHDRGAECVTAIYRLARLSLLHALDNPSIARTVEQSHAVLRDFAAMARTPVTVTFLGDTVFFCGQLLKASRDTYGSALELGGLLARCGVSEVSFDPALTPRDLLDFATAFSTAVRDPERRAALVQANIANITIRPAEELPPLREDGPELPHRERILRFYASALVSMRQFYGAVAEDAALPVHRVKRLAQQLVTLAEGDDGALLGMTAMANAHRDDAGRAVQSALLAVALGRRLTTGLPTDRVGLSRLAMAAFMMDVGRVRLAGPGGRERGARLAEAAEAAIPPLAAAASIAIGGVSAPAALRTAVTYETTTLEREPLLGPLYQRRMPALVQSRILYLVRTLLERLAPRDASIAMGPLDALEDLARMPKPTVDDGALLRLLIGLLGVVPVGTVVELDTGEWAVVMGPSVRLEAFDRPRIRIVTDKKGRPREPPIEVDLGSVPEIGRQHPALLRIVPPKDARMNVARVFLI